MPSIGNWFLNLTIENSSKLSITTSIKFMETKLVRQDLELYCKQERNSIISIYSRFYSPAQLRSTPHSVCPTQDIHYSPLPWNILKTRYVFSCSVWKVFDSFNANELFRMTVYTVFCPGGKICGFDCCLSWLIGKK